MTSESNQTPFLALWCFRAPSMQLFPCLPTAHPLFSIIICFLKLLSINNESRQRETSLLLISCHITSKTAPAKWAENGDGFNWKRPHLLHRSKTNEANSLGRHTGKFNPHGGFRDRVETILLWIPNCRQETGPWRSFFAPSTGCGPTPSLTSHETFKSKKFQAYLPLEPTIMQGDQ